MIGGGVLGPTPLVTHHAALERAGGLPGLRPPRGAQDRDDPVSHDVERGTSALLLRRRETLAQGAEPLGWKIGFNVPEIGASSASTARWPVISPATACWRTARSGRWARVERWWSSPSWRWSWATTAARSWPCSLPWSWPTRDLERDPETILAGNIFHRAVAFGPRVETQEHGAARILVNGEATTSAPSGGRGSRRWWAW